MSWKLVVEQHVDRNGTLWGCGWGCKSNATLCNSPESISKRSIPEHASGVVCRCRSSSSEGVIEPSEAKNTPNRGVNIYDENKTTHTLTPLDFYATQWKTFSRKPFEAYGNVFEQAGLEAAAQPYDVAQSWRFSAFLAHRTLPPQINPDIKCLRNESKVSRPFVSGCKIKALRAKTNTYIKTPVRGEEPVFVVTGRKEDVAKAKREILSAAEHFSLIRASRKPSLLGGLTGKGTPPGPPSNIPGQITILVRVPYRVGECKSHGF